MPFGHRLRRRELVTSDIVLTASSRRSVIIMFWVFVILLTSAVAIGVIYVERLIDADQRVERLHEEKRSVEAEKQGLQASLRETELTLERAVLDLEIAAVTQLELERQISVLNENLKQVKEELEYVRSAAN